MLAFITESIGSGKTTRLLSLAEDVRARGVVLSGVICPAVFENETKVAIDALLLPDENRFRLAERYPDDGIVRDSLWNFSSSAFEAVNAHLAKQQSRSLIIDEIGPQELCHGRGFISALSILDAKHYQDALVVVRPSLLSVAQERWGPAPVFDVSSKDDHLEMTTFFSRG